MRKIRLLQAATGFVLIVICVSCAATSQQSTAVEKKQAPTVMPQRMARIENDQRPAAAEWRSDKEITSPSVTMGTENVLAGISREIAEKVYADLRGKGDETEGAKVAVTVAVPLSDFKRETEFGRLLAEYILTDLGDHGVQVAELRLGKEIIILPQTGEFILTRNVGELHNSSPAMDYVVVSTFTNTKATLIIQGRLVAMKTGLVETSWRYTMPLNREVVGLFYDNREVTPATAKPFTMAVKGLRE